MSAIDTTKAVEALLEARRAVDEALRVLRGDGTPPPLTPSSRPAEAVAVPVGCKHVWVLSGFGTMDHSCSVCGAKRVST